MVAGKRAALVRYTRRGPDELSGIVERAQTWNHLPLRIAWVSPTGGPAVARRLHAALRTTGWATHAGAERLIKAADAEGFAPEPWAVAELRRTWQDDRVERPAVELLSDREAARIGLRRSDPQTDHKRLAAERRLAGRRARERRLARERAEAAGVVVTIPGECPSCGASRPVLAVGDEAGCPVAGSVCGHCGHVEPS